RPNQFFDTRRAAAWHLAPSLYAMRAQLRNAGALHAALELQSNGAASVAARLRRTTVRGSHESGEPPLLPPRERNLARPCCTCHEELLDWWRGHAPGGRGARGKPGACGSSLRGRGF